MAFTYKSYDEWVKDRAQAYYNELYNSTRGSSSYMPYNFDDWYSKAKSNPNFFRDDYNTYLAQEVLGQMNAGNALQGQGVLAASGVQLDPSQTEYMNNLISQGFTDSANAFTREMRDTSLSSAGAQLSSLGLSPSNVMSTGGAGIGSTSTAQVDRSNGALQQRLNDFNQKAQTTRTLLGLIGGLASAGIFGGANLIAKNAASKLAASTAHSATRIMNYSFNSKGEPVLRGLTRKFLED